MGLIGPSSGSSDPGGRPTPNGPPLGPPSSGQLIGGPWCCSFVFPGSFVGLVCHLALGSLYLPLICQKCLFSWSWADLLLDVGPLILMLV